MRVKVQQLTPAQSRAVAIVLAMGTLVVCYFLMLHWWFVAPVLRIESRMRDLRALHARYAVVIAQQPELQKRVARLQRDGVSAGLFLSASNASEATAKLIQEVSDVVAAHAHEGTGCRMPSAMPVPPQDGGRQVQEVAVSITLDCDIEPLIGILHGFDESGSPYLFVDNLRLGRAPSGRLWARLTISGYLRRHNPSR